ncbi:MAG: dihydropteroate synthase [Nitrosomonas sp.]|uniref:dihydropteroate synthase n=1 Tax=Nitrosomonas sp. TaxID=42353 RepID=UPI0025CBD719|nr:dihydropteroate synthase [Nitrosomonas sp.]MCG7756533.1 dihydropteroate synthase [Nitrosomonas sp.]UJP03749.1 MAG: dihydropteroate synthase [Nitrosomonas sp.]UJP07159.1 MAG: dihydropteroate synthase [Nitrosomonas sp.]
MGIINVTPDSFSDGGLYLSAQQAIAHAKHLIDEGADILDIGGESTRPGSQQVSIDEELNRVIPVLEALADSQIPLSVDTSKPEVMKHAIAAGAFMINDVNALRNPGALEAVAPHEQVQICLMHMQGTPQTMQANPQYYDIVQEVKDFLQQRIQAAKSAGIAEERLVIDPGFGFGKTLQHNFTLLNQLDQLTSLGVPLLAGLSRKSMLGAITGNSANYRIHESIAAALLAVVKGAKIVRVHDVKATKEALAIHNAMRNCAAQEINVSTSNRN